MAEKKLVPELRFPEFKNNWNTNTLGSIATFSKGKGISKADIIENGELACIRYGELYTRYAEIIDKVVSRTNVNASDLVLSEANDVIIPASGETKIDIATASCVLHSGIALGGDLNIIKSHESGVFLAYYLNNARKKDIAGLAQGISVVHLYANQLKTLLIHLPDPEEQQKIATFLTAVDQRIQLLQKKKAKLEEYKKGVMQKLFSREIRFRDENGNNFPDWEEKRLGDLYSFKSTNSFSREKLNYKIGVVKNIHYGDIHTKFSTSFDITQEQVPYINPELNLNRIADENYVQEGDLVIADASENYADIGKTIEIIHLNGQKVLAGLHTFLARRKDDSLVIGFGGQLMKNSYLRKKIYRIAQGSKVLSISSNRLSDLTVKMPIASEQQKIASFLSSLDRKIEQIGVRIEKMQAWKKGLIQKMFV